MTGVHNPGDCIDAKRYSRTTPAVRTEIAASNETASVLAQCYGITEQTVSSGRGARSLAIAGVIGMHTLQCAGHLLG